MIRSHRRYRIPSRAERVRNGGSDLHSPRQISRPDPAPPSVRTPLLPTHMAQAFGVPAPQAPGADAEDAGSPAGGADGDDAGSAGGRGADDGGLDAVTAVQRRLDQLATLMFTYVGIVQRDAPPAARPPEEAEEAALDEVKRRNLAERAPEYAEDIVLASEDVGRAIERIAEEVERDAEVQKKELVEADARSLEAGRELGGAAEDVGKLLGRVREAISLTEKDL